MIKSNTKGGVGNLVTDALPKLRRRKKYRIICAKIWIIHTLQEILLLVTAAAGSDGNLPDTGNTYDKLLRVSREFSRATTPQIYRPFHRPSPSTSETDTQSSAAKRQRIETVVLGTKQYHTLPLYQQQAVSKNDTTCRLKRVVGV